MGGDASDEKGRGVYTLRREQEAQGVSTCVYQTQHERQMAACGAISKGVVGPKEIV